MDPAVGLVEAYLQINGYLTVTEFPIHASGEDDEALITDVDVIALRFPGARPLGAAATPVFSPDPILKVDPQALDLLICEVKEGKARLNPNISSAITLRTTLERVGCCPPQHVEHHVRDLLRHGKADMVHSDHLHCRARLALFAGRPGDYRHPGVLVVGLKQVATAVLRHLRDHRGELRAARLTQPALAYLHLLDKLDSFPGGAAA